MTMLLECGYSSGIGNLTSYHFLFVNYRIKPLAWHISELFFYSSVIDKRCGNMQMDYENVKRCKKVQ